MSKIKTLKIEHNFIKETSIWYCRQVLTQIIPFSKDHQNLFTIMLYRLPKLFWNESFQYLI